MNSSFGGQSDQKISLVVSQWWRDRVQMLIDSGRADDARCLYREFGDDQAGLEKR